MKKSISILLIILVISILPLNAFAEKNPSKKEEVVYGILDLDGRVDNIYVVNIFEDENIIDYGNYEEVSNMTTSDKIKKKDDKITIKNSADRLYYKGTLKEKNLPWNIKIEYILDGKKISGKDLAGKSGELEINVAVSENSEVDSTFFDNYALQIALSLDTKLTDNIKAENATIAEAGSKKQLTYTVLPGEGINFSVKADVKNFETEAITINGIKMNLGIEIDNEEFTGQIAVLTDAIKKLDDGAGDLLAGVNSLADGMNKYTQGVKAFKDGLKELDSGAKQLDEGVKGISDGLLELDKQKESLVGGALEIQKSTFDSVNEKILAMNLELPILTPENYSEILKDIPDLEAVKDQLDGIVHFTEGLKGYTEGVSEIGSGAVELKKGSSELNNSTSKIQSSANDLYNGAVEINSAIKELKAGLSEYKGGTNKLKTSTSNIDSDINNSIDEIVGNISGNGDEIKSFVSDKNTNVKAVQFIMKTEEIKIPEENIEREESKEPSFLEKLLALFGIDK